MKKLCKTEGEAIAVTVDVEDTEGITEEGQTVVVTETNMDVTDVQDAMEDKEATGDKISPPLLYPF